MTECVAIIFHFLSQNPYTDYATALEKGETLATIYKDEKYASLKPGTTPITPKN